MSKADGGALRMVRQMTQYLNGTTAWLGLGIFAVSSCGGDTPMKPLPKPVPGPIVQIVVAQTPLNFGWIPQQIKLDVTASDQNGTVVEDAAFTFSSDDPTIVTVDSDGRAQAVAFGVTSLTVSASGVSATTTATVRLDALANASGTVAFVGVTVLPMDGAGADQLAEHTVIVRDGWITDVGPQADIAVPADATIVDGTGRFLMPGLIDSHTHPIFTQDLIPYVVNGVTTIVTMGMRSFPFEQDQLGFRRDIEAGALFGPTMIVGALIDGPGGIAGPTRTAATLEDATRIVSVLESGGYDFAKAYNDVPAAVLTRILAEADQRGLSIAAHGVRSTGMEGMLSQGVKMVAHGEEYIYTHFNFTTDATLIPSAVEFTRRENPWVTPNLSTFEIITKQWGTPNTLDQIVSRPEWQYLHPRWRQEWVDRNPYIGQNGRATMDARLALLHQLTGAMSDGGVALILGTDSPGIAGMYPGFSIHDDLRTLVASGLTPYQALVAGTRAPSEMIRTFVPGAQPVGLVRAGMRADLILLEDDPLVDVTNIRNRAGVMTRGRWLPEADLQALLASIAQ